MNEMQELVEKYKAAVEAGDTREALLTADAILLTLLKPAIEQQDVTQLDTNGLLVMLAGAVRLLIARDTDPVRELTRLM